MSLIYYIEFAGIHTDPFFRFGGNRNPKLDVRFLKSDVSDKCAFGLQELQPSFPPSLHPESGSSNRSFKAINKDMSHSLRLIAYAKFTDLFFLS